jgi:hypothetical protein
MYKLALFAPMHPCLGFIHQARFNGLLFLLALAVTVSVTVFVLSKPR